jgi:hypothetical protein
MRQDCWACEMLRTRFEYGQKFHSSQTTNLVSAPLIVGKVQTFVFFFSLFSINFQPCLDFFLFTNLIFHHFRMFSYNLLTYSTSIINISPMINCK